jgi:DNA polymerase/3'-5' exonuclease PolX
MDIMDIMDKSWNTVIINEFEKLIYNTDSSTSNYKFKIISYKKVISIINQLDFEIIEPKQLKDIKGIGKSTLEKIDIILKNGRLNFESDNSNNSNSKIKNLKNLQKITGIGPRKAEQLLKDNITLEDLLGAHKTGNKDILDKLTHHQQYGVKYYGDLENRIPYSEITQIEIYINSIIKQIDRKLGFEICGSYRRQCETSGDIDILLYHETIKQKTEIKNYSYLNLVLVALKKSGFIIDDLTSINSPTKYMGFCKINKFVRRIDIRLVPKDALPFALLYFTGSGDFNKKMRSYALTKNYSINEYGITDTSSTSSTSGKNKYTNKIQDEKDIFNLLGLNYVEPKDRLPSYKF